MKMAVSRLRLSPNEEARIIQEERERRRKLRIQQVLSADDLSKISASFHVRDTTKYRISVVVLIVLYRARAANAVNLQLTP